MKTVYQNASLLDGTENMTVRENISVLVEDGIITGIGDNLHGDRTVDLNGRYMLPGLINMHVHIPADGFPKEKEKDNKKTVRLLKKSRFAQRIAKRFLCDPNMKTELLSGCTTIRSVGGVWHMDTMIREEIEQGKLTGPRLLSCDYAITVPGGHMEGLVAVGAKNDEEFVSLVEDNISNHVDWIKLMVTGGVLDARVKGEPGELKMSAHQIRLCTETAHRHGVKVCAHAESTLGVEIALQNDVDCIEHSSYMNEDLIMLFKQKDAALICTLSPAIPIARFDPSITKASEISVYNSEYLLNGMISGVRTCLENGVKVGIGTDTGCPFVTHYDMWRELEYFHRLCGVERGFALYTATLNNARLLGIDNETGSIETGKSADFIICEKNPLASFEALRKLDMVVFRGKEYARPVVNKNILCERELDRYLETLN